MNKSDAAPRIQQLYSLYQPHAARAHALLDQWDRDNPLETLAAEPVACDEFVSLVQRVSDLPVSEVAALLDAAIAADKEGKDSPDLGQMMDVLSKLDMQVRSAIKEIRAFAQGSGRLPAPLSSGLQEALKTEEVRLERDRAAARARMITEHDLRILRDADVPRDTIEAIVRDAPKQDDIDQLSKQLKELRQLLAGSANGARFAEQLGQLEVFTNAALELLGPILDPMVMQQVGEFAQPLLKLDDGLPRGA